MYVYWLFLCGVVDVGFDLGIVFVFGCVVDVVGG